MPTEKPHVYRILYLPKGFDPPDWVQTQNNFSAMYSQYLLNGHWRYLETENMDYVKAFNRALEASSENY